MRLSPGAFVVVLVAVPVLIVGQATQPASRRSSVPDFGAISPEEATRVGSALQETYYQTVADLLRQIRRTDLTPNQKAWPIFLLGQYRGTSAASELLRQIDLKVTNVEPQWRSPRWGEYPAAAALSKMGGAARELVLNALPKEEDETRRRLMTSVLYSTDGADTGIYLLRQRLERAENENEKARIEAAIEMLGSVGR